jgi:hypothetical protein
MNTFQAFLSQVFVAASVSARRGKQRWLKAHLGKRNPRPSRPALVRAFRAASLPQAVNCGACHYLRSDPAWVSGVFSGLPTPGSGFASACAAAGLCRCAFGTDASHS